MSRQSTFWARRRAGVEAEAEANARLPAADEEAALVAAQSGKDDATLLQELGLPDPETLVAGDDFAAFMAREVPKHLKNRALRTLWRSNPVLACVDGLNDYDDDYRAAALSSGPIKTSYQVGKGMLAHLEEMARQKDAAELAEAAGEIADKAPEEVAQEPESEPQEMLEPSYEVAEAPIEDEFAEDAAPRRMKFRFEEAAI